MRARRVRYRSQQVVATFFTRLPSSLAAMPQALYERRFPVQSVNADHNRHRRPDQEKRNSAERVAPRAHHLFPARHERDDTPCWRERVDSRKYSSNAESRRSRSTEVADRLNHERRLRSRTSRRGRRPPKSIRIDADRSLQESRGADLRVQGPVLKLSGEIPGAERSRVGSRPTVHVLRAIACAKRW